MTVYDVKGFEVTIGGHPVPGVESIEIVDSLGAPLRQEPAGAFSTFSTGNVELKLELVEDGWAKLAEALETPAWQELQIVATDLLVSEPPRLEREGGAGWTNLSAVERNAERVRAWRLEHLPFCMADRRSGKLYVARPALPLILEEVKKWKQECSGV